MDPAKHDEQYKYKREIEEEEFDRIEQHSECAILADLRRGSLLFVFLFFTVASAASNSTLEHQVHDLVNAERAKARLATLKADDKLSAIARAHSEDMARRHFFAHVNPNGEDPTARGHRAGYECRRILGDRIRVGLAENLYEASGTARDDVEHTSVAGWMNSPGHRANILYTRFRQGGVGIYKSPSGEFWVTEMFLTNESS